MDVLGLTSTLPIGPSHSMVTQHLIHNSITNASIVTLLQVVIDMTIVLCASNGEGQARRRGVGGVNVGGQVSGGDTSP